MPTYLPAEAARVILAKSFTPSPVLAGLWMRCDESGRIFDKQKAVYLTTETRVNESGVIFTDRGVGLTWDVAYSKLLTMQQVPVYVELENARTRLRAERGVIMHKDFSTYSNSDMLAAIETLCLKPCWFADDAIKLRGDNVGK